MEHYVIKCRACGKVLVECPCPGIKLVRYELCEKCHDECREVADRYGIPPGDLNIPELF